MCQTFNGAVTFSLRKCASLYPASPLGTRSLQWGRNFFVTEIRSGSAEPHCALPSFNGAVTFSLRKYVTGKIKLGDGSTFNGAVTFSLRKYLRSSQKVQYGRTFNGAVTFSLRKFHLVTCEMSIPFPLQWGRNFFVTEIPCALTRISMRVIEPLQWGRNFFVTEIVVRRTRRVSGNRPSMGP